MSSQKTLLHTELYGAMQITIYIGISKFHSYVQIHFTTTDLLSCFSSKAIKNLYAQVGMDHQSTVEGVVFSDESSTPKQTDKNGGKGKI